MSGGSALLAAVLVAGIVWLLLPTRANERCRALADRPDAVPGPPVKPEPLRLAATFDLLAAALVAGLPPGQAVSTVAAALPPGRRAPLQHVAVMLDLSAEPRTVWEVLANDESLGPLGRAMLRADDSGAPIADGLQVLANDARQAARTERLERARRVGVRTAAPLGVCFLPAFLLVAVLPTILGLIDDVF